ncbi:hypothetical protein DQ238_10435 [Geodermatophilus sp. TF02-6]|nr:hypothetical protein DQ238_10435 [Geodermatophilus sp. TF02-6]
MGAAGALTLTGVGVALADPSPSATPTTSSGSESSDSSDASSRHDAIVEALGGLVDDGTLTQEQADKVASTLDDSDALGHGGWRGGGDGGPWRFGLDTAADALGMTSDQLADALSKDGTSLADVAAQQGVPTQTLVDALTNAARDKINQAVADGDLSQSRADDILADLPGRISDAVQNGSGWGWWRHSD